MPAGLFTDPRRESVNFTGLHIIGIDVPPERQAAFNRFAANGVTIYRPVATPVAKME